MLRTYLSKYGKGTNPFPTPDQMADAWRNARRKASKALCNQEILKIPLKNLRNYSGARLYLSLPIRDPIAVMRHLRHKKLDTTMHYIRGMVINYEDDGQWTSLITQSPEEECKAIENGYQLVRAINKTTAIYKKRKQ